MIGLDSSFLVAWAIPEHPEHSVCRRLAADAVHHGRTFGLTAGVLAEFIHVVTDPRRFAIPLTMADATAIATFWAHATEVSLLPQPAGVATTWLEWLHHHRLGRNRLLDTLLAATWDSHGITDVFTLNPADFEVFAVFSFAPSPVHS